MPTQVSPRHFDRAAVFICPSRAEMGMAAAGDVEAAIDRAIASRGEARIIVASAPSQSDLLDCLMRSQIAWERVTIFHMDEYVGLPADHPATFRAYQREHVLSRIEPRAFHGIRGEATDLQKECERYAALLAEGPIDVVCLGVGENGHLAFNDPPVARFSDNEMVKVVELDHLCRQQQVNDGCFPDIDSVPTHAITLTIPALLRGGELFCVVPGPRKAPAVQAALQGEISTRCPASVLREHPAARIYLDEAAASLLDS